MKKKFQNLKVEVHCCALKEPTPGHVEIVFNGKSYRFHFYINNVGRYVAISNTVGCDNHYGEGANWWLAVHACMDKILPRM